MEHGISPLAGQPYTIITPVYEGPLDLLLQLIEHAELDITRLALAQITDQYLAHLNSLVESSAEEVSAFLVIAAKLIQIKSEALLPRPPTREPGEEDPGDALARQLIIYKRFKTLAGLLAERQAIDLRTYPRSAPSPRFDSTYELSGVTIDDLIAAARLVFSRASPQLSLGTVVAPPRVTIREKIGLISNFLRRYPRFSFRQLLTTGGLRLDIVVTFLALLELIKRQLVQVHQDKLFADIQIEPDGDWNEEESFELEFGE
jgi:segregation and condensation protein A